MLWDIQISAAHAISSSLYYPMHGHTAHTGGGRGQGHIFRSILETVEPHTCLSLLDFSFSISPHAHSRPAGPGARAIWVSGGQSERPECPEYSHVRMHRRPNWRPHGGFLPVLILKQGATSYINCYPSPCIHNCVQGRCKVPAGAAGSHLCGRGATDCNRKLAGDLASVKSYKSVSINLLPPPCGHSFTRQGTGTDASSSSRGSCPSDALESKQANTEQSSSKHGSRSSKTH